MARLGCIAMAMVCWMAAGAQASSVTNNDSEARQLTIIEGGQQSQVSIKPGERIDDVCLKGCILRLENVEDGDYILVDGTEIVSIENEVLYYEGAEKPRDEDVESQAPGK